MTSAFFRRLLSVSGDTIIKSVWKAQPSPVASTMSITFVAAKSTRASWRSKEAADAADSNSVPTAQMTGNFGLRNAYWTSPGMFAVLHFMAAEPSAARRPTFPFGGPLQPRARRLVIAVRCARHACFRDR